MIEIDRMQEHKNEIEYIDEVLTLSEEAQKYLRSFNWCNKILNGWLAESWGYMLCLFYFEIEPDTESEADDHVWIIVGDLPPAYIDIESAHNEWEAVDVYVYLMKDWIDHAKNGKSVKDCFPVNVEPSEKYANMLLSRIEIIESDFLPELDSKFPDHRRV